MAASRLIKHNPALRTDAELEEAFVVRTAELQILANLIRDNRGEVNQHALVIGLRGMGKTMLVRRLGLWVRCDPELKDRWYPIVAPEEIYDAGTEGEIWLAVLRSLADQLREEGGDFDRWNERYRRLIKETDEDRLRAGTLGALIEFSSEQGKRLLVVIENLQMLLGEQFAKDADWDLRKTLLNRPEIMLVLTATTRFAQIAQPAFAAYELFRELELRPLSTDGCRELWEAVSGQNLVDQRIRPMEILTGGNPRLLAILATFAPERPLQELMDNLAELIDDHTPFLKSNIDALPPQERRVFVNLAKLWEPSSARRVGERCRLTSNTTSAVLKSLVNRGVVVERGKEGRGKLYQVAERIYSIYYLMRLSGSEADRMRAFVRFMVPLYGEDNLARSLAEAACASELRSRLRFIEGYRELINTEMPDEIRERALDATPPAFLALPEVREFISREQESAWDQDENSLSMTMKQAFSMISSYFDDDFELPVVTSGEVVRLFLDAEDSRTVASVAEALVLRALGLQRLGRKREALETYDEVIERLSGTEDRHQRSALASALNAKASLLVDVDLNHLEEAIETSEKAVALEPAERNHRLTLAWVYGLAGRWTAALEQLGSVVDDEALVEIESVVFLSILVDAAADGQAGRVLTILSGTAAARAMEPLLVALKELVGEKYRAPQEVEEVKKDLLAKIAERKQQLAELRARAHS